MAEELIKVRHAEVADLHALVELRLENGRVHVELDPTMYRVPETKAVEQKFSTQIAGNSCLFVATTDGHSVMGMMEVVPSPPPPDDQILRPLPSADIHIVVSRDARGHGVGRALLQHAERWAATHGIERLVAGIQADNTTALGFYDLAGYRDNGRVKIKEVAAATE